MHIRYILPRLKKNTTNLLFQLKKKLVDMKFKTGSFKKLASVSIFPLSQMIF